jgi:hypothetical protein
MSIASPVTTNMGASVMTLEYWPAATIFDYLLLTKKLCLFCRDNGNGSGKTLTNVRRFSLYEVDAGLRP